MSRQRQDSISTTALTVNAVSVGDRLPELTWSASRYDLLKYACVSRDLNLIHHDPVIARDSGLPDTIVQGTLKSALLARLVGSFIGASGRLCRLAVQYRGIDVPDQLLTAHGQVTHIDVDSREVTCDLWIERSDGSVSTRGSATVLLPLSEAGK